MKESFKLLYFPTAFCLSQKNSNPAGAERAEVGVALRDCMNILQISFSAKLISFESDLPFNKFLLLKLLTPQPWCQTILTELRLLK